MNPSADIAVNKPPASRSARGLSLILVGNLLQSVLRLALAAVTARFVAPAETGIFQLAFSVVMLGMALADPGLSEAMVRLRRQSRAGAATFFWVNAGLGALLGAALLAIAGPVATRFGQPESQALIVALASLPLLSALAMAPFVELRRQLRFAEISLIETGACIVGCIACVVGAAMGAGAWSLAFFQFAWYAVRALAGFVLAPTFPRLAFRMRALRRVGWFCANVWAAHLAAALATQLDKIIIGAMLGAAALGHYSRGALFMSVPIQMITAATVTALVPAFARLRGQREALASEFIHTSQVISLLTFPAFVGAAVLADPVTAVVLGRGPSWDWTPVAALLSILAVGGVVESLLRPQRALMLAQGRAGTALALTFGSACTLLAGVAIGSALGGLKGAALGSAGSSLLMLAPATALAARQAGTPLRAYVAALWPPLGAALAMGGVVIAARLYLAGQGVSPIAQLAILIPLGGVAYVACLGKSGLRLITDMFKVKLGAKPTPA